MTHDAVVAHPVQARRPSGTAWRSARLAFLGLVLVAAAFSSPAPAWLWPPWPGSVLDTASLLAVPVLVADLWRRGWVRPPGVVLALAAVVVVLAALSTVRTPNPGPAWVYVTNAVQGLVLLWTALALTRGEPARVVVALTGAWVVALLVPCALMWSGAAAFQPPSTLDPQSGDYISYFARLSHPWIGRSNNLAVLLVVPVVPLAAWGARHRARFAQVLAGVALVGTVLTVSRGTLLALAVGAVLLVLLARPLARTLWRWAALWLAVSAVALLLMYLLNPATRMHLGARASATNVDARFVLLSEALSTIAANPVSGAGPSATPSVHNVLLQQVVDFGVVGGLVVALLLVLVVLWWFRAPRRRGATGWLAVACGVAVAVQLGSCLVEASYDAGYLRMIIWLSWGLLLALYASESGAAAASPDGTPS